VYSQNQDVKKTLLLLVILSACSPTVYGTAFVSLPPKEPDSIISVYEATSPACLFEEIGMLTSPFNKWVSIDGGLTFRRNRTMEKVLDAFRVEARKIGGDALITPVSLRRLEGIDQSSSVDSNDFLSAIVIRFMDPECQRE
jgi:hypothetical protein